MITSLRIHTYDGYEVDKATGSYPQFDALDLVDEIKSEMIKIGENYKITEDWRAGTLFDILIERFK